MEQKNKYQQAAARSLQELEKIVSGVEKEKQQAEHAQGSLMQIKISYDYGYQDAVTRAMGTLMGMAEGNITVSQPTLHLDLKQISKQCRMGFSWPNHKSGTATHYLPEYEKLAHALELSVLASGLVAEGQSLSGEFTSRVR